MRIDITNNNFGLEIRKKLLELNITQREFAKQLGITEGYLSDILNDNREALDIRRKMLFIINAEESRCAVNE